MLMVVKNLEIDQGVHKHTHTHKHKNMYTKTKACTPMINALLLVVIILRRSVFLLSVGEGSSREAILVWVHLQIALFQCP